MYKRIAIFAVLAALLAPAAWAQEGRKLGVADTAKVTAVDLPAKRIELETADGTRTYAVEAETRIVRGEDEIALDAIDVGDRVILEAHDEMGDATKRLIADRIVVVVEGASSPSD